MNAEPYASAHCDAIHVGDVRLTIGGNEVIKPIFEAEVVFNISLAVRAGSNLSGNGRNVTASAKGFSKFAELALAVRAANYNDVG